MQKSSQASTSKPSVSGSMSKHRHSGTGFERIMGVQGGATRLSLRLGKKKWNSWNTTPRADHIRLTQRRRIPLFSIWRLSCQIWKRRIADCYRYEDGTRFPRPHTSIFQRRPGMLPHSNFGTPKVTLWNYWLSLKTAHRPDGGQPGLDELFLGIDHSAISVRNSASSLEFYRGLGLHVSAQTINKGHEQQLLDGLHHPEVEVTALSLPAEGPHLELLCYRSSAHAEAADLCNNDIAATRTIFGGRSCRTGWTHPKVSV